MVLSITYLLSLPLPPSFCWLGLANLTVLPLVFPIHAPLGSARLRSAQAPILQAVVEAKGAALGLAYNMADVLEDFFIAVSWFHVAGHGAGGQVPCSLLLHQLVLSLLGLRKLCSNDHQA